MPTIAKVYMRTATAVPQASTWNDAIVLASANTAESYTVPAGGSIVFINGTAPWWMRKGGTAAVPTGDVTDGTAAMFQPAAVRVAAGDSLSFVSATAGCIISLAVFTVDQKDPS